MRLTRIILTGIVAAFALVTGLFIAAIGLIALLIGKLFGRPGGVRVHTQTQFSGPGRRPAPRSPVHHTGDVIDVTATEVPANPLPR
jgi:hypothetical protein